MLSKVILGVIAMLLVGSLINSDMFIYQALTSYFLYIISAAFLLAFTGARLATRNQFSSRHFSVPIVFIILWITYVLLHGIILDNGLNLRHNIVVVSGLLIICLSIFYAETPNAITQILRVLVLVVFIESAVCVAQFFNFIESKNAFFSVTGTWVNPNVVAMFIALAIPAIWYLIFEGNPIIKNASIITLIFSFSSLSLLNCRTAWIGAAVSTAIILFQYCNIQSIVKKIGYALSVCSLIILVCAFIFISDYLYKSKQASADGRMFIWKVSLRMASEEPVTGYGYGLFERSYNLFQASYINSEQANPDDITKAAHVKMAYNEVIENTIEGGLIGGAFFLGFILLLIIYGMRKKSSDNSGNNNQILIGLVGVASYSTPHSSDHFWGILS